MHKEWQDVGAVDLKAAAFAIVERASESLLRERERITTLHHVGMTMGSCGIVCLLPLFLRALYMSSFYDFVLAFIVLVFSVVLLGIGWIKLAQMTEYDVALYSHLETI